VPTRLKLLTYNIHRGVGCDRRYDIGRIERVLREESPDIITLQEVDCGLARSDFDDQVELLSSRLGLTASYWATSAMAEGHFGLATLSRFPVAFVREYDLSYRPRNEPRFCFRTDLDTGDGVMLHVFNCHLGLATMERRFQRRRLLSDALLLSEELHHPVVLMGDFNDRPVTVVHHQLRRHFLDAYQCVGKRWNSATFQFGPLAWRLDHIYVSRDVRVLDCRVRRDELTRVASDHRPLIATIEIDQSARRDAEAPA